jgi:hypothetical protein
MKVVRIESGASPYAPFDLIIVAAAPAQIPAPLVEQLAPGGTFLWNQKVLFHLVLAGCEAPWATVNTKRTESLDLTIKGPKDAVAFGRICAIGWRRELDATNADYDVIKFQFRKLKDLHKRELRAILSEHRDAVLRRQTSRG